MAVTTVFTARERDRFARLTDRSGECWIWIGAVHKGGYGVFQIRRRSQRAHRIAWEMSEARRVPDGLVICHRCDNRRCVNPKHLFLGTHGDNNRDTVSKGRWRKGPNVHGEANCTAKLSNADVALIRAAPKRQVTAKQLAERFGVHPVHIYRIRAGKRRSVL
jgi:hypothetical protein